MKKTKKIGLILCALILTASLITMSGCDKGPSLKGLEIVIGNWWSDYDTDTFEPQNESEERTLEWRKKIQQENGFKMVEKNVAGWGEFNDGFVPTSIMSGSPAASAFVMQINWAMAVFSQSLAYPVTDSKVVNFRNPQPVASGQRPVEWNTNTLDVSKFGGKSYAFSVGVNLDNAGVVFFNKRLFREAGLDPNLPYDLQKSGEWTWDKFLEICHALTRDIDGDGIMDTYALARGAEHEILPKFVASNGGEVVGIGPDGKYYNASNRPEFLEAVQFCIRLNNEGVLMPAPEGANWDWFKTAFMSGETAFRIEDTYVQRELSDNMRDDWGLVLMPKGPRVNNYRVLTRENVMIIPSTFSDEEVEQILYALSLWYTPQNPADDWKNSLYHFFSDRRAVDETYALIRDTSLHMHNNNLLVPNINVGEIAWSMFWHEGDPAQLIEAVTPQWNAHINDVNAQFN